MQGAGRAVQRERPPLAEALLALAAVWTLLLVVPALLRFAGAGTGEASVLASFAAAVAVAWLVRPRRDPALARSIRFGSAVLALVAGALGYAACMAVISNVGLALGLAPLPPRPPGTGSLPLWIASIALAPAFEEILYRGRLLAGLRARVGALPALVATSALFAAPHLDSWSVLGTFLMGLVFGGVRLAGAPLTSCIALHAGLNLASVFCGGPPERLALPASASFAAGAVPLAASLWVARRQTWPALFALTPHQLALRNRAITGSLVVVYLALTATVFPVVDERASFNHFFVLTLGYGHLLGAVVLSRRRLAVPSGVPVGLWRAFLVTGGVTLFAAYGVAIQHAPTLVLGMLAFSTWHSAENDLGLAGAYARGGRLGPVPRSGLEQLGAIGIALLVLAIGAIALTPAQLEETVRGTLLAGADFGLPCAAAALCGLVLVLTSGARGSRGAGGGAAHASHGERREDARARVGTGLALVAGAGLLALTQPAVSFADVFAATTLYHLVSWLVLLADRARLEPALAGSLARRVVGVHLPAAVVCAVLVALPTALPIGLPTEITESLCSLVFSPGIYLFFSVLHALQTAAVRGLAAPSRQQEAPAAQASVVAEV